MAVLLSILKIIGIVLLIIIGIILILSAVILFAPIKYEARGVAGNGNGRIKADVRYLFGAFRMKGGLSKTETGTEYAYRAKFFGKKISSGGSGGTSEKEENASEENAHADPTEKEEIPFDESYTAESGENMIRPEEEHDPVSGDKEEVSDGKKENKYTWLSSNLIPEDAKPGSGTGAKTFVHYACDFEKSFDGSYRPVFLNHTAFLTEGAMKADLAHMFTGQGYVAVPGVNALLQLEEEFKKLRKLGVSRIINAYDMDYLTNPHVFKAVKKTEEMIHEMGFFFFFLMWDTKEKELGKALKGIDDYYAYCYKGIVPGKDIKENA